MKTSINSSYLHFNSNKYKCYINEVNICPMCKHAIKPVLISSSIYINNDKKNNLVISYLCRACNEPFLVYYKNITEDFEDLNAVFKCGDATSISPQKFKKEVFNEFIEKTSPSFISIYNQALESENYELNEIAGIGYRKALEFLIKDFLILQTPDKSEQIKKDPLGACINKFINNEQLKTAASRAVWLGNDQTHYIQKFTDKDINDLKRLIRLTVHWISMILETEDAENIQPR